MLRSRLARTFALVSWLASGASCGGSGFEPPSKIQSVRVLALQKEPPYARPGETVSLKLLYWDGRTTDAATVAPQFTMLQCENPPADLYYNCYTRLGDLKVLPTTAPGAALDASPGPDALGDMDAADAGVPDEAGVTDAADPDAAIADAADPDAGAGSETSDVPDASAVADASDVPDASIDGAPSDDATTGADAGAAPTPPSLFTSSLYVPTGIIRPRPQGITPYGLVYVLFSACAGELRPASTVGTQNGLPIGCFQNDKALGPNDFVPGYASIYVYDEIRNANPIVKDLAFQGISVAGSFEAADADVQHIPKCTEGDRAKCPSFELKVDVDPASAEVDPEAKGPTGEKLQEQLWVAYHSTDGDFSSSLRLVNDATKGWNADHAAKFRAPTTPGPVRLFAIVHDNRGGVAWALGKIVVD